jgi:hypothetical protein
MNENREDAINNNSSGVVVLMEEVGDAKIVNEVELVEV